MPEYDDCDGCGFAIIGEETYLNCGLNPVTSKALATGTVKHKKSHSIEWAKKFVADRVAQGAAYDAGNHRIYCVPCREMYMQQAEECKQTNQKFAMAIGIPDGPK